MRVSTGQAYIVGPIEHLAFERGYLHRGAEGFVDRPHDGVERVGRRLREHVDILGPLAGHREIDEVVAHIIDELARPLGRLSQREPSVDITHHSAELRDELDVIHEQQLDPAHLALPGLRPALGDVLLVLVDIHDRLDAAEEGPVNRVCRRLGDRGLGVLVHADRHRGPCDDGDELGVLGEYLVVDVEGDRSAVPIWDDVSDQIVAAEVVELPALPVGDGDREVRIDHEPRDERGVVEELPLGDPALRETE
nr:MAG: hypothetical protein [Bacteriophage sp.]